MKKLFTSGDKVILREQIKLLSRRQAKLIYLRFWENKSTQEIACEFRRNWDSVYRDLQVALGRLRRGCLANPDFSRSRRRAARAG